MIEELLSIPMSSFRFISQSKNKLIDQIKNFQQRGPSGISKAPHPFFGPLTVDEWNTLEIKHLEHHLSQFGA